MYLKSSIPINAVQIWMYTAFSDVPTKLVTFRRCFRCLKKVSISHPSLYKEGWEIETFFKHLKQRLKVTSFVGTSENAVYIQIWTVLIGILLFKYIQKKAKYDWNLSNLVNFIRLNIFVKIDLWKWANDPFFSGKPPDKIGQFKLF